MGAGLICVLLVAATPDAASPEDQRLRTVPDVQSRRTWYGWQTIVPDVASSFSFVPVLHSLFAGAPLAAAAGPPFLFATISPSIHLANREPWSALWSFLLRITVPPLSGLGLHQSQCRQARKRCSDWINGSFAGGVLLGGVVVSILDALFLGYKNEPIPRDDHLWD